MLKRQRYIFCKLAIILDLAITVLSFVAAYYIRAGISSLPGLYSFSYYAWMLVIVLFLWGFLFFSFGVYDFLKSRSLGSVSFAILKGIVMGVSGVIFILFLLHEQTISRTFLLGFSGLNFILLVLEKAFLIYFLKFAVRDKEYPWTQILVVGGGKGAEKLAKIIEKNKHWGLKIMGYLDFESSMVGKKVGEAKVLGVASELSKFLREYVVDHVVFTLPFSFWERFPKLLGVCEEVGISSHVVPEFNHLSIARMKPEKFFDIPMLSFSTTPEWGWTLFLKGIFDRVSAFLLLLILSPIFFAVALGVKISSPGPVFFKQKRSGLNGRKFIFYKFRSMVKNAEEIQEELKPLDETSGPVFKVQDDPRLTKLGKFLRRSTLDELPQLINVFTGEMSLVGPRPPIPSEVEKYDAWQRRRLSMKPGMTCIWQISGRSEISFDKWMEMDLEYIDNWSLGLDFKILIKTIPAILSRRGAW